MDNETYTELMQAIGRYARLHIGDVEDIAIVTAGRAVFDLITAYADARAAAERASERERCALIAEQHKDRQPAAESTKRAIAAAIRLGLEL